MTNKEVLEILQEMQKWRRGIKPYDDFGRINPYSPTEYGQALDIAIEVLKERE